jgi:pimeloyl-ACP methyl ester carboxylesterase
LAAPGLSGGVLPPYSPEERAAFEFDEARSREVAEAWSKGDRELAVDRLRRLWCAALEGRALEHFRTMVGENLSEVFDNRSMKFAVDVPAAEPRLPDLQVPTTILVGDRDNPSSWPFARRIERSVPRSRLVSIPRADHLINLSEPAAFDRELEAFLRETRA